MDSKWVSVYDMMCLRINKAFGEMFVQKIKDFDERDVKIIARINGESVVLTQPIVLDCIEIIKK